MKKMIFTLMALMLTGGMVFAQSTSSVPGHGDGAHYNQAHTWLWVDSPVPDQVQFELANAHITLDPAHVVPNNPLTINVEVRNDTGRTIQVTDEGFFDGLSDLGFHSFSVNTVTLAPDAVDWLRYNITTPNRTKINEMIQMMEDGSLDNNGQGGGGHYVVDGQDVLRVVTKIIATGVDPSPASVSNNGF